MPCREEVLAAWSASLFLRMINVLCVAPFSLFCCKLLTDIVSYIRLDSKSKAFRECENAPNLVLRLSGRIDGVKRPENSYLRNC